MIERYEDFEIVITQQGNQLHANLGIAPGGRNLTKDIPITLSDEDYVAWTEAKQGRRSEAELAELGHRLFKAFVAEELSNNWHSCLGEVCQQPDTGLRLRFSFQAETLTEAPLELLCRRTAPTCEFLALDLLTPVVRSLRSGEPVHRRPVILPLRMLVVIANPKRQGQLDPIAEQTSLEEAMDDLIRAEKLKIDYLGLPDRPSADYATLQRTLAQTKPPYDILHFIGHGAPPDAHDREAEGILLFVDPQNGRRHDVRASDLAGILARNGVRAAVLQACDGARPGTHNAFQGVAQRLIAGRLPAVVAMQCPIDKDVAAFFCSQLYHFWLAKSGLPLERAVTEARQAVRQEFPKRASAWWAPVLFIHSASTEVLEVDLTEMVILGKVIRNKYRILELLGSGAMGDVYLAKDETLRRKVAVKHLKSGYATDEEALERFQREARRIAKLRHTNIAIVHGWEQEGGQSYIVMEYAEKGTLAKLLSEESPFPIPQAIDLAIALCRALAFAHSRGVSHRDIKPSNILLIKSEGKIIPKLSDFGLSSVSQSGLHGTLQYTSPEQLSEEPGNVQSDIYSLGMVLYEMLTGTPPFTGSKDDILRAQMEEDPLPLRSLRKEILPSLEKVVLKALSKTPEERYQTAQEMIEDLERFRQVTPETVHRPGLTARDSDYEDTTQRLVETQKRKRLQLLYIQANALFAEENWQEAAETFQEVLALDPGYEDAASKAKEARKQARLQTLYTEGIEFLNNGEWERAINRFEKIHHLNPDYKAVDVKLAEARRKKRLQDFYDEYLPWREREDRRSPKPTQYPSAKAAWIVVGVVTVLLATLCVLLSGDATWEILRHLPSMSVSPSPVASAPTMTSTSTLKFTPFSTPASAPVVSPTATPVSPTTPPMPPTVTKTPTQTPAPPTATATHTPRPPATPSPTVTATHTPRPPATPTPTVTATHTPTPIPTIVLTIYFRGTRTEKGFAALSSDQPNGEKIYEEGKCVYGEAAVQIDDTVYHFDKPEVGPGEPKQLPDSWRVEFEFAKKLKDHTTTREGDGCAEGTPDFDPKKAQFWVGPLDGHSAVGEESPYSLTMKLYYGNEMQKSIQVFFTVKDAPESNGPRGTPTKPIPPP